MLTYLVLLAVAGAGLAQEPPKPANGVYAVLREGVSPKDVQDVQAPHTVLVYDRKYSDSDKHEPPRYVALDTSFFVPLILAGPPEAEKDTRGWTMLHVTLAPQHAKTLEELTRRHLGGRIATVIDGEVITMHKVQSVITDGKARITRCTDNACETLRLKLVK